MQTRRFAKASSSRSLAVANLKQDPRKRSYFEPDHVISVLLECQSLFPAGTRSTVLRYQAASRFDDEILIDGNAMTSDVVEVEVKFEM